MQSRPEGLHALSQHGDGGVRSIGGYLHRKGSSAPVRRCLLRMMMTRDIVRLTALAESQCLATQATCMWGWVGWRFLVHARIYHPSSVVTI